VLTNDIIGRSGPVAIGSPMLGNTITPPQEAREVLNRVASSAQFQKSKRLRELLLYLGDRALKDPNCTLREQEVGVDVLGRPSDYDTSHDTLVRVLVSHLRKKLQEHFAAEGRNEPLVIEIPKGSYLPVFRARKDRLHITEIVEEGAPDAAKAHPGWLTRRVALAAAAGLALGLAPTIGTRFFRPTARPTVEGLWSQLFGNGQATYLVLSDVTLIEFEKLMGWPVPLSEYEAHEFDRLAEEKIKDPIERGLAREFVNRVTTATSDVQVARDFGVLAAERHLPLTIVSARDLSSSLLSSMNSILLGSWRANPWVGLFEDQMTFRTEYQESPPSVQFVNRSPVSGEQRTYQAEWRRTGYCRIAFLSNPRRTGNVLLVSGSDVISTEAGGRFMMSEDSMLQLRQKLGLKAGRPMPHFELLLRTRIVNSTVPSFEVVAWRPHGA
jgi:hypothetical protein